MSEKASRPTVSATAGADAGKPDRATVRAAQRDKFEWTRQASSDPHLSQTAKHLASRMAIDKFGPNGTAKATQKELAKICGTAIRVIRRAINELENGFYLEVWQLGGANKYVLIAPVERVELWDEAKADWEQGCHQWRRAQESWEHAVNRWLKTEAEFTRKWLDAEATHLWLVGEDAVHAAFTMPIFNAAAERARLAGVQDLYGLAIACAEHAWTRRSSATQAAALAWIAAQSERDLLDLAIAKGFHPPPPRCADCSAEVPAARAQRDVCEDCVPAPVADATDAQPDQAESHGWPQEVPQADQSGTLGGPGRYPRRTQTVPQADQYDTLSSGNGDSTSTSSSPRTCKYSPSAPHAAARLDGASGADAQTQHPTTHAGEPDLDLPPAAGPPVPDKNCQHCDTDGWLLDGDPDWDGHAYVYADRDSHEDDEYRIPCRHSRNDTIAEIQAMIASLGGSAGLTRTSWREINRHFGHGDQSAEYIGTGEMDPERSWECV